MFKGSSPFSDYVDAQFLFIVGISALVFLGLVVAMILFIVKYSRKKHPYPANIEGNVPLEVVWTIIPLGLFMYMFYLGWTGYQKTIVVPEGAHPIKVTARMWAWSFEYPNGVRTDTLYIPVNTPIRCTLHSLDVNHKTPRVASYDIACAEYCGLRHSYMYTKVVAVDSVSFEDWYRTQSTKQSKPYQPMLVLAPPSPEPAQP
jgi:cytochrome c oxidase subunit II